MGGTDDDQVWGDLYSADLDDLVVATFVDSHHPGADVLLGDGGEMLFTYFTFLGSSDQALSEVTIIRTIEPGRGCRHDQGNELDDVVMGGFEGDVLYGESSANLA